MKGGDAMAYAFAVEVIATKIVEIRGKKVMTDADLADLYGVSTKYLNKAVKRNYERFPADFMYQLKKEEMTDLRFQFGTSRRGGRRYLPYVFTQEGIAMLSSVLNSKRAIRVNILIMRAFVKLRKMLLSNQELSAKIEALERKYSEHDQTIRDIFDAIKKLLEPPAKARRITGFSKE
jgi:phage regulator Rha-like protein